MKGSAKPSQHKPVLIWFSGLSGSGKTTLSEALEVELRKRALKTYVLDGDKLRAGLCKDLGFSEEDRAENIRRVGEVAKLMLDAGIVVLAAFITPFERDRQLITDLIRKENIIRVFVDCPLEVCEKRDVKGLYKKARTGEIKNFTGISSPFEIPSESDYIAKTANQSVTHITDKLLDLVLARTASTDQ